MIVLEDADLKRAVKSAVIGRFDFSGQFCNATKRVIVRREVEDQFLKMLKEELKKLKVGDPLDESVDVAPLISEQARDRMGKFLEDAVKGGGEIVMQIDVPKHGNYFPPTVIKVSPKLRLKVLWEETFGPILPVIPVDSDDEAINVANSAEYGLDASIFTSNFSRAYEIATKLKVGTVVINDTTRLRWDNLPFGGVKKSGIGRESVVDTMIEMTETKLLVYSI
jgi:succinyl-CoA reductase